ncbi:MAG: response regulator [Bdellovibrionales bacterium]|nr:response regulator [Bdellovibrionales bacterium]
MFDPNTPVLVVDDMKTMRKLVIRACTQLGFTNFTEAGDGAEAWSLLSASDSKIGLVISDWNMPNATGLDLLKRVRSNQKTSALPFLLLTAESEASQVQTAVAAGVDSYIVKPFTAEAIETKLKQVYAKKHAA